MRESAMVMIQDVESTINNHSKKMNKLSRDKLRTEFYDYETQKRTISEIQLRILALENEIQSLKQASDTFTSYCFEYNATIYNKPQGKSYI